jgi:hypothetical protein
MAGLFYTSLLRNSLTQGRTGSFPDSFNNLASGGIIENSEKIWKKLRSNVSTAAYLLDGLEELKKACQDSRSVVPDFDANHVMIPALSYLGTGLMLSLYIFYTAACQTVVCSI